MTYMLIGGLCLLLPFALVGIYALIAVANLWRQGWGP